MGKQGPCRHCGVTSTPLWRNGPPDKPVLCNACGSRWRTRGTLTNYTPLHARDDCEDHHKVSRMKTISINKNKELKSLKRKQQPHYNFAVAEKLSASKNHGYLKVTDEDISNRSSSGSAISNAESCAQFSAADASDFTDPAQSVVWETLVPSKKRTDVGRSKSSSVDKLAKDLYTIMQEQQSSYICGSSEEDSLYESEKPMFSIGYGGVLIKHPSSITREEESEASSLSFDNKSFIANEAYQRSLKFQGLGTGNNKQPSGEEMIREKSQHKNSQILTSNGLPLSDIDLKKSKTGIATGTIAEGPNVKASSKLVIIKRSRDSTDLNAAEVKNTVKSPRVNMKVNHDEETVYIDSSCFSPRSLFTLPPDNSSLVLDSFNFKDETSDQDMLLDVPSNNSFPQAELLHQTSSYSSSVYPLDRR